VGGARATSPTLAAANCSAAAAEIPGSGAGVATRFADFADREGGCGVGIGGGGTALLAARAQVLEGDFGRVEGAGLGGGEHRDSQRTDQAQQCRSSKTHRLQLRLIAARSHYEGKVAHAGRAPKYVRYVPLLRAAASSTPRS